MKKRFLSMLTAVSVFCSAAMPCAFAADAQKESGSSFTDVPLLSWYQPFVQYVYDGKIFSGTSETTFSPNENITRAQLVTVLGNLEGKLKDEDIGSLTDVFPDVPIDKYYAKFVGWAYENGLISGYPDGKFHPDDMITREQIAVIIDKYIQMRGDILDAIEKVKTFADSNKISDWAAKAAEIMTKYGIISGKPGNEFDPKGYLTRAEAAVIITRLLEAIHYPTAKDVNYQSVQCDGTTRILTDGQPAEDEAIQYQFISDYDTYMEIVSRAQQQAEASESITPLDQSFFEQKKVIAIELNHEGNPLYQTKLCRCQVHDIDGTNAGLDAVFFSSNLGGSTADAVSYVFFIEVDQNVNQVNSITEIQRIGEYSGLLPWV